MAANPKFQAPKGTRDFFPADLALRRHVESAWRRASVSHGFDEIEGPTFEHLELYTAKSGPGIASELFSFRRAGGENDYALRPEFTPTLARMVAARAGSLPPPIKWFGIPVHYRAERPQRGRLREFVQWNVDLLGLAGEEADAEVIAVAVEALRNLGLGPADIRVRISHRGLAAALVSGLGVPAESAGAAMELLDRRAKLQAGEFERQAAALGLSAGAVAGLEALAGVAAPFGGASERGPSLDAHLAAVRKAVPAVTDAHEAPIRALASRLAAMDLAEWCDLDLGIVRGLAYYTGTVFEIHESGGTERAVAGGGRYDGLVELFGGPSMPAVGFGMGDVVLTLVLQERGLLPADAATLLPRPDAFLIPGGPEGAAALPGLAARLRRAGLHVRYSYRSTQNVGKLLGDAGKARARFAVILGAEMAQGAAALKDLDAGTQRLVPLDGLQAALVGAGAGRGAEVP
ncbi:MAG: histidine--tRNA ligase [Phycisphaerales bacterium]